MMKDAPIVIIGAGIGGLSTAIRLAAAGQEVIILEQNAEPGGKMSRLQAEGFTWDRGPSVITMRHVFEELFSSVNRKLEDYLNLSPIEPLTRYFYPDGSKLDATRDLPAMLTQIQEFHPKDVEGYLNFLAYAARLYRIVGPAFIYDHPPTWRSFLRVPIRDWFRFDGLRTMDDAIRNYLHSPKLQQFLGRFATYVGASPYQAPATLNVITHVELNEGLWYPHGGVYQITTALSRLATELGVQIHFQNRVTKIQLMDKEVQGVTLASGDFIPAQYVISNVDVTTTHRIFLSEPSSDKEIQVSGSGFILLLGIARQHPELTHHNIFFSADYKHEFKQIFEQAVPADAPTIYVAITSKTNPEHAPSGCENWFVLVNVPPVGSNFDWTNQAIDYKNRIINLLASHGYDLQKSICYEAMITPMDLEHETGAWRGALYGASSNNRWAAFRRNPNRDKLIRGLYFVGGSTHPGGGVPMVMLSGKVTAEMVLMDMD
jgi:phytoene desaturase